MNICFFIGKIVSEIKFDFIIDNHNISIVRFKIKIEDGTIIKVKGYNKIADRCYRKLEKGNFIFVLGKVNSKLEIIIKEIEI